MRPLVDAGVTPAALTLGGVPDSVELSRLRQRRTALGLPADDDAPLLLDVDRGWALLATRYASPQQPLAAG